MKKPFSNIPLLLLSLLLFSCSPTNMMTLSVTEPAPVYVPSTIHTVGILNRSNASKQNTLLDNVDKILSAEGKNLDKDGARKCLLGLRDELRADSLFTQVKILDSIPSSGPGMGVVPTALSWDTVDKICKEGKVDALFELSSYDTDAKIGYSTRNVQVAGPLGVLVPALEHHASVTTTIKTYWRIYDPVNKIIRDELPMNSWVTSTGVGINPLKAVEAVMGRKEAVMTESNKIGQNYALRLIPYKIRVAREYFIRGTDNFKIANRRAQAGDWAGAAELWNKEVSNPKGKVAGRACYNMAISNEIDGFLDEAVKWAQKSYSDYNIKLALRYLDMLNYRKARKQELDQQAK